MGELFLIVLFIVLLVKNPSSTLLWAGGILLLILIAALFGGKGKGKKTRERPRTRINHPHLITEDEYECAVCGGRFRRNVMTCPHCGVRFNSARTDETEFDEEEDEWAAWDEEEGW